MEIALTFPAETKAVLESPGITVESVFVNDDVRRFMVMVHRVALNGGSPPKTPSAVVKFSERQHAIPVSPCIQLATPRYYRDYPGEGDGIRDEQEASYINRMDWQRFLDTYSPQRPHCGIESGSVELTYDVDSFWMFCTAARLATENRLRDLGREFSQDYDCATTINNPSEFARQLGKTFGTHLGDDDVSLSGVDILSRSMIPYELGEKVVWVYHGQVVYADDPASVVESYPEERRAAIVPFVKRSQFADQWEYRFIVSTTGAPKRQVLCLPVSDNLRALAETGDL